MSVGILTAVLLAAVPLFWLVGSAQRGGAAAGLVQETPSEQLRFEYMGPPSSGRISAVAGIPGDTMTYYAGAASGGIWKTTDGGKAFVPIFDDQPVQAIGALAVASSDPKIVWAGTGEAWAIRDADVQGDGVYKSTDAGATWKNMGLKDTGRISRIIVHPKNPDIVFVAALGRATGPQGERGVYRTTDGGATWQRVLFVNRDTGISGLAMDANNPDMLFAAGRPLYGTRLEPATKTLVVGPDEALRGRELTAAHVNWLVDPPPAGRRAAVRIRSRHEAAPAALEPAADGAWRVRFDEPQRAITPGQVAALYDGDTVLGAGTI